MKRMEMAHGEPWDLIIGALRDLTLEPDYPERLTEVNRRVGKVLGIDAETESYSHNIPYCINRIRLLNIMLEMVTNKSMNIKWFEALYKKSNLDIEYFLPCEMLNNYYRNTGN